MASEKDTVDINEGALTMSVREARQVGITKLMVYCLLEKVMAILCWSSAWTGRVQKPDAMSKNEKDFSFLTLLSSSCIMVIGHLESGICLICDSQWSTTISHLV